jgi:hypothetical protein
MSSDSAWRVGNDSSRLILDVAAGRAVSLSLPVDEDQMMLAHGHGLLGLMADSPNAWLRDPSFPAFVRWSTRQEIMKRHLRRLLASFDLAGIPVTVLKGPYLAEFVYRKPIQRTFSDVDLLVRREDLDRALEGIREDPAVSSIPRKKPKADKREIPVIDRVTGIAFNLDLHWDLFSYTQLQGCADGATEDAWKQARGPVDTRLGPIWHLPDAAWLAFLCTHALLDHRFRLVLFRDLTEAALHQPNWDDVGRFAGRWGLRGTTYLALLMASKLTAAPVPTEFLASLRPRAAVVRITEALLPRTDLVRFDGHRPHPLNLAIVLLHDSAAGRIRLAVRAPVAFPSWMRRVTGGQGGGAKRRPVRRTQGISGAAVESAPPTSRRPRPWRSDLRQGDARRARQFRRRTPDRHDFPIRSGRL